MISLTLQTVPFKASFNKIRVSSPTFEAETVVHSELNFLQN